MTREAIKVLILLSLELLKDWVDRNMKTESDERTLSDDKKNPTKKRKK